ncbi:hypothetical protein [Rhizobium sp. J15]|uniref:hypothetical protein n=1 Tax=Rhizobium sp. J15 TaxID=2035450 RepID=UPI001142C7C4|nr:hypothetical protein [Rhizobium sp. J15]
MREDKEGPTYLDFITPDEVFDRGPDAVKAWQEKYMNRIVGNFVRPSNPLKVKAIMVSSAK